MSKLLSLFHRRKSKNGQQSTSHATEEGLIESSEVPQGVLETIDGPLGMKVLADPLNAIVDIIFVHGLTGNRETTWTHKNKTFWPQMLSADASCARIMTFGYDANPFKFFTMAGSNNLRDNGRNLAHAASNIRAGCEGRPIIFVAHSLGGLVIEEALLLSEREAGQVDDRLKYILQSTCAIAFMGTPHGGAQLANWGTFMAEWLGRAKRTNSDIVAVLRPNSEVLTMVDGDFQRLLQCKPYNRIKVLCFYETVALPFVGFVVPKASAELPQYSNIPINANHRDMVRFSGQRDNSYQLVLGTLLSWIGDIRKQNVVLGDRTDIDCYLERTALCRQESSPSHLIQVRGLQSDRTHFVESLNRLDAGVAGPAGKPHYLPTTQESNCHHNFRNSEYELHMNRNAKRVKGTCEWFLRNEKYIDWRNSNRSGLLWVSADPGCGKSVLSRFLVEEVIHQTRSNRICYFFFKDDNDEQMTATNALCAILHQLFSQSPRLLKYAVTYHQRNGDKLPGLFFSLWELFIEAVADPEAVDPETVEIICIIDALDECRASDRRILLESLCRFYGNFASGDRGRANLKVLVTSRRYHDIEVGFKRLTLRMPTIHLAGDGEEEVNMISREIELVIDAEVDSLGAELELEKPIQTSLKRKLREVKNRTYLWLKLILEVIRARVEGVTEKGLVEILRTIPTTLDEAYEAILAKSTHPEGAKKILRIVCAAVRPLSLKEMNMALHIESNNRKYEEIDLKPQGQFASIIRKICGLFVSVKDERVYLIHLTAKEFLISTDVMAHSQTTSPIMGRWKHSLVPTESNLVLTMACIWYLQLGVFATERKQKWLKQNDIKACVESHPFLEYSALNWIAHFKDADVDQNEEILRTVLRICDISSPGFRLWFPIYWFSNHRYSEIPDEPSLLIVLSILGLTKPLRLLLATSGVDINSVGLTDRTPFSWAVTCGNTGVVRLLLDATDVAVNLADLNGQTPLSLAAELGHTEVARLLLGTPGVEVNSADSTGRTPLSWAAEVGETEVVRLLLATPEVEVNSVDNSGRTPLFWAAEFGQTEVVRLLLEVPGLDPNLGDSRGKTPLMAAVRVGDSNLVRMLLAVQGLDVTLQDDQGLTALCLADKLGREKVVQVLLAVHE